MNYYRRYIGDFQADTMALSLLEQGAYDRLLDYYYASEKPIPLNTDRAAIICRALTLEDRAAVQAVLETYFERREDGWHNARADKEIALARVRSEGAKVAGKLGAEARWNGNSDSGSHGDCYGKDDSKVGGKEHDPPTTNHQPRTKPLRVVDDDTGPFGRFWAAWPKSGRKVAKAKCLDVWSRKGLDALADEICSHVEAMKSSDQWKRGYEPAPLTYLNQQRWRDGKPERAAPRLAI